MAVDWIDLDGAFARVMREAKRAEARDLLCYQDFAMSWEDIKHNLADDIANRSYVPRRGRVIDLPKDQYALRPLSLMAPEDLVVYDAVCAVYSMALDAELSGNVYSGRIRASGGHYRGQRDQRSDWIRFQRDGLKLHKAMPLALMLTTDVTSYFEYVDIETLITDLRSLPGSHDPRALDLLSRFLNGFNRASTAWGLPQGPPTSSLLGNYYLLPVDRLLALRPVRFVRFQDDIKVFGDSKRELRLALRDIIQLLRLRHLSLSVHKTKILSGAELDAEFEDDSKGAITYGLAIGDPRSPQQLRAMFDEAIGGDRINTRDVRFAVYRLGSAGDDYALQWILENLDDVPFLSSLLVQYLALFAPTVPTVEVRVREYLDGSSADIYPYVEVQMIRMFSRMPSISEETHQLICRITLDSSKDEYVREHAARCVGRHSRAGDQALLRGLFVSSHQPMLRRALLVALREANAANKGWLGAAAATDPTLRTTVRYLNSEAVLPPP